METKKSKNKISLNGEKKSHFSCNICISMKPNKLLLEMQIMDEQKKMDWNKRTSKNRKKSLYKFKIIIIIQCGKMECG